MIKPFNHSYSSPLFLQSPPYTVCDPLGSFQRGSGRLKPFYIDCELKLTFNSPFSDYTRLGLPQTMSDTQQHIMVTQANQKRWRTYSVQDYNAIRSFSNTILLTTLFGLIVYLFMSTIQCDSCAYMITLNVIWNDFLNLIHTLAPEILNHIIEYSPSNGLKVRDPLLRIHLPPQLSGLTPTMPWTPADGVTLT